MKHFYMLNIFIITMLLLGGCQKYEQGPAVSFKSEKERLSNNWKVDYAEDLQQLNNVTTEYRNAEYQLLINDDGAFTLSFYPKGQRLGSDKKKIKGNWTFNDDATEINWAFSGNDPYGFLGEDGSTAAILRLKIDELWLRSANMSYELHLVPE